MPAPAAAEQMAYREYGQKSRHHWGRSLEHRRAGAQLVRLEIVKVLVRGQGDFRLDRFWLRHLQLGRRDHRGSGEFGGEGLGELREEPGPRVRHEMPAQL